MTIASEITRINNNIANAYTACNGKGATMPVTQNSANLADCIDSIQSGSGIGIPREVVNGVYQAPVSSFTFSLPNGVTNLGERALCYAFYKCIGIIGVDFSNLTNIDGIWACREAFRYCTNLITADLSGLISVGANGYDHFRYAFGYCSSLTTVDVSNLYNLGSSSFDSAFQYCTSLTSINFSSLGLIKKDGCLSGCFRGCTSLTTLYFPALTSTSFGSSTDQFYDMVSGVTGCTVHFPSNLQSVIGSWSDVTAGFGGTNTTVLFDLPATT